VSFAGNFLHVYGKFCSGAGKFSKTNLKKEAYRDGIKRKGDKMGMGYTKHG
jgi:hypothetical protein